MKICFLGTGAADWISVKRQVGHEYRRCCSALIDDVLLLDPGPQVLNACKEFKKDVTGIQFIICTHNHGDHFCEDTVRKLMDNGTVFLEMKDKDKRTVGKYTIYAYQGNHGTCQDTLHFIITDGEKTIFYGLDSAWLLYDEVCGIKEHTPDLAILDATIGESEGDYRIFEHNNLKMILEMKKTLQPYIKKFCISHMSFYLHTDHKTLEEKMNQHSILVAYDGLEVQI